MRSASSHLLMLLLLFFIVSSHGRRKYNNLHRRREHDGRATEPGTPSTKKDTKRTREPKYSTGLTTKPKPKSSKAPTLPQSRPTKKPIPAPPPTPILTPLITFSKNALKVSLPDINQSSFKVDLSNMKVDDDNSTHYEFILNPTSQNGQLVTLTRVDRDISPINERRRLKGQKDAKPTFIPVSRSYDGNDWERVPGKYLPKTDTLCGYAANNGDYYSAGEYLCKIMVPKLEEGNVGYYLTYYSEEDGMSSSLSRAARFLQRVTWGPRLSEIEELGKQIETMGDLALAMYLKEQLELPPTSHREYFRKRLNPRAVESYQYAIVGPKACEMNARFRRFAFTHKDVELSIGSYGHVAGNTGLPMTAMSIESIDLGGSTYYQIKFGKNIRTILKNPLQYNNEDGQLVTLANGNYTICSVEEVVGTKIGEYEYNHQFQVLVGDICKSSYTNRGGVDDGYGDGAPDEELITVNGRPFRFYDRERCMTKCNDASKVKLIIGGNPPIEIPDAFDKSKISWIDATNFPASDIVNINKNQTHDSVWLLKKDLDSCVDENGNEILDPAEMANTDYSSKGRGKYNLDPSVFVKLAVGKWAIQDLRSVFSANTLEKPMKDGGGHAVRRASRSNNDDDHLVVRCSNVERNIFNEHFCQVSYETNVCVSKPMPDPKKNYSVFINNPGGNNANGENFDRTNKYFPPWAGPNGGGVIVCGSPYEVEPDPDEENHYDATNRKVQSNRIDYDGQKRDVWVHVNLDAKDQLCQKLAWHLSKTFATSTNENVDSIGSEQNIKTYDTFVTSCKGTFKELVKKQSNEPEMSLQLTFLGNMGAQREWHRRDKRALPDENYGRENLQLHSMGQYKLNDDGTVAKDPGGRLITNYGQRNIVEESKVWTGQNPLSRTGNAEELDMNPYNYKDFLIIRRTVDKDWFAKIDLTGGYLGDKFPLCADLPNKHWLKKGSRYTHLAGSSNPSYHEEDPMWDGDPEIYRLTLDSESPLFKKLCRPKNHPLPLSTLQRGDGIAGFNALIGAPTCTGSNETCDSGKLLEGRITESNGPNTIDGCADGANIAAGLESVKRIIVKSTKGGRSLRGGEPAIIQSTVISKSLDDRVDFYCSDSINTTKWTYITSVAPMTGEFNVTLPRSSFEEISFTLPRCDYTEGCQVAVRVVLRSGRDPLSQTNDGSHKPTSQCGKDQYDDNDDLVFDILPSERPQDSCDFQMNVELDENLLCFGEECLVDTVSVVEVVAGVYYEYVPRACVYMQIYDHPVTVFSGYNIQAVMCANKKIPCAMSTCCGSYDNRHPDESNEAYADVPCEFRKELVTFDGNEKRCALWGKYSCKPTRIGPFSHWTGHCLYHQCCKDVMADLKRLEANSYHWTTAECFIQIKVNSEGLVAIVHKPTYLTPLTKVQSHVHPEKTISFFNVHWNEAGIEVGKLNFPNVDENSCDGGEVMGDHCLCDTVLDEKIVFNYVPTKAEALAKLKIGFFDIQIFDEGTYIGVNVTDDKDVVSVFRRSGYVDYSTETVFRIWWKDHGGDFLFLKNVQSTVRACDGTFSFRNPPSFFDEVAPQLYSAYQEMDAYIDHVDSNDNTPRFVCMTLLKNFGYSNPSPAKVYACTTAYKEGVYTFSDSKSGQSVHFGRGDRGSLPAIVGAILLHDDTLSLTTDLDPMAGGVREPQDVLMNVMRSFHYETFSHHFRYDGLLSTWALEALGEGPYGIPNQFGYFRSDFIPSGHHKEASLFAPESAMLSMGLITNGQNGLYALIEHGLSECDGGFGPSWQRGTVSQCGDIDGSFDHTAGRLTFTPKGDLSKGRNVVDQLALLLTGNRVNKHNRGIIETEYEKKYVTNGPNDALKLAQTLMVSTAEFRTYNTVTVTASEKERLPSTSPQVHNDDEYSAVVVVFLEGGMDCLNMLVPHPTYCSNLYKEYKEERGESNHLTLEELITIDASTSKQPCNSFGMNKHLKKVAEMYTEGEASVIAGIGYLPKFVNKHNYQAEPLAQLFAHPSMIDEAAKVNSRVGDGVLGRIVDKLSQTHSSSKIAIDKDTLFLLGDSALGIAVDVLPSGPLNKLFRIEKADSEKVKSLIVKVNGETTEMSSLNAELWSQSLVDAKHKTEKYIEMLSGVDDSQIIPKSIVGKRLNTVSKMIKVRSQRGVTKDFFFLEDNSYDHHFEGKTKLNPKLDALDAALNGFRQEMKSISMWHKTTVVVVTEFGRTVSQNSGGGTDHAWLGHALLLGGGIKGGVIHGNHPSSYRSEDDHNIGRGLLIPKVPFEALWSGIAQHVGVDDIDMEYVLPKKASFGCELLSEKDLYREGIRTIPGCGGGV